MKSLEKKLARIAKSLGFRQEKEYPLRTKESERGRIGKVDFVWLKDIPLVGAIPVVGFEIETSWRTSKHLKGDVYNLFCLNSAVGIVLFIKEGFDAPELKGHMDAVKRYSKLLFTNSRTLAWTEEDVEKLEQELFSLNTNIKQDEANT